MFMRNSKVLAVVTLCAFASGCSSYRSASLPRTTPADALAAPVEEVKARQNARITLVSGHVISGEVTAVTADSITVGRPGNYGMEEDSVAASDIARLEVEHSSKAADIVAISVTGVLIIGTILIAVLADAFADGFAGSY